MNSDLKSNRNKLLLKTQTIVDLIIERKSIVKQIQSLKVLDDQFKNFDPQREAYIFNNLKGLSTLSTHELLSLSLLIEGQVKSVGSYPSWSEREHLEPSSNQSLEEQVNPILLATVKPKSYDSLLLKSEFKVAIDNARNNL